MDQGPERLTGKVLLPQSQRQLGKPGVVHLRLYRVLAKDGGPGTLGSRTPSLDQGSRLSSYLTMMESLPKNDLPSRAAEVSPSWMPVSSVRNFRTMSLSPSQSTSRRK